MRKLTYILLTLTLTLLPCKTYGQQDKQFYDSLYLIQELGREARLSADTLLTDLHAMNVSQHKVSAANIDRNLARTTYIIKLCIECELQAQHASGEAEAMKCEEAQIESYNTELQYFEAKGEFKKIYRALRSAYNSLTSRHREISKACRIHEMADSMLFMGEEFLKYTFEAAEECI